MDDFWSILNSAHDSINFTIEQENNDELASLDVQVKGNKNRFLTLVYRKKSFQGCYTNF